VWPIQLSFLLFTVCRTFLSSLTLCSTSSFLTRSVQPIFSTPLQHHISKLSNDHQSEIKAKLKSKKSLSGWHRIFVEQSPSIQVAILSCSSSRQVSDYIPADAGFLCDKDAVLGVTTKGTPCCTYLPTINLSLIVPFLLVPKTKLISFEGRDPVRSEIVIRNEITEKVNFLN
jgi:hypothetical protein